MTQKTIVLAAAFLLAAMAPASAGTGIYLGLGAGWASQSNIDLTDLTPPVTTGAVSTNDGVLFAGTLGFKLPAYPVRMEFESGYDWHSVSSVNIGGKSYSATGHNDIASELFNAIYDFPIGPGWNLYGGGGIGTGHVHFVPTVGSQQLDYVDHWALMWQAIAGVSLEFAPDAEVFVDYRYRDARAVGTLSTPLGTFDSGATTENVVMAGVRFYMFAPYPEGSEP